MATHQLGPEAPRPFSVLSEGYVRQSLDLPFMPDEDRFSFGPEYATSMCQLVDKHLEVNTNDSLCYVGDPKGTFAPLIEKQFCLMKPITTVVPGHIHYEESPSHRMLPFRVANVGAAEFFRTESSVPAQFDKVLLMNAVGYLEEPKLTYQHVFSTLQETGKLLIIHRAAPMCTLPMFSELKERMLQYDQSYLTIIKDLQGIGCDVQWEIEILPVRMSKLKWMTMIRDRFPSELEAISTHEVMSGLRELSEGVMKYSGDIIEFPDRLMFITATKPIIDSCPIIGRRQNVVNSQSKGSKPQGQDLFYQLQMTKDIASILQQEELQKQQLKKEKRNNTSSNILP